MEQKTHFDYLVLGSGMAGLSVAALLAHAGHRVGVLEKHETAGGYAHTFDLNGYEFSAQVHYIWGCGHGEPIHQFLSKIGLEDTITFERLDPNGYDHAVLPDGKRVKFPYGRESLIQNIDAAYPGARAKLDSFFEIIFQLYQEISKFPYRVHWWHYITKGLTSPYVLKYHSKTLQDVFNECQLSKEHQAVLCCQSGDLGAPPAELSVLAYTSLFVGYNKGAYYPTKHFKFFTQTLTNFINDHEGCKVLFESEVSQLHATKTQIESITTVDGRTFTANHYICNIDPQSIASQIGWEYFSEEQKNSLRYQYSPSAFMIYLGLKDIDLREYGFGAFNIWQLQDWDMNATWSREMNGGFEKPWLFLSAPYLRSPDRSSVPPGGASLEIGTLTGYEYFKALHDESHETYKREKERIANLFLDSATRDFIPNLRDHIVEMAVGTPLTNESFVGAPFGNCYGSQMTPHNLGLSRLKRDTPWPNLSWCNASSGYAGVYGTVMTGTYVYEELTGDRILI
ncbi:MAG: NAD(P)/FAD-dependent oxidoreductase [Bdellovibrionales bacterium]|nr:NAD(P)/FAD-dependent oxidoreductase [Bdellovibrionales bacterium]